MKQDLLVPPKGGRFFLPWRPSHHPPHGTSRPVPLSRTPSLGIPLVDLVLEDSEEGTDMRDPGDFLLEFPLFDGDDDDGDAPLNFDSESDREGSSLEWPVNDLEENLFSMDDDSPLASPRAASSAEAFARAAPLFTGPARPLPSSYTLALDADLLTISDSDEEDDPLLMPPSPPPAIATLFSPCRDPSPSSSSSPDPPVILPEPVRVLRPAISSSFEVHAFAEVVPPFPPSVSRHSTVSVCTAAPTLDDTASHSRSSPSRSGPRKKSRPADLGSMDDSAARKKRKSSNAFTIVATPAPAPPSSFVDPEHISEASTLANPVHLLLVAADPVATLSLDASRPRSPTLAEMDAFFGFVPKSGTMDQAPDPDVRSGSAPQYDDCSPGTAAVPSFPVYQLRPLPSKSLDSGLALTPDEKRLAIIDALERLALSVFTQLIASVIPPLPPSIPSLHVCALSAPGLSESLPLKKPKTPAWTAPGIAVTFAKRSRASFERSQNVPCSTVSVRKIVFPRKDQYGTCGSSSLAMLLKVTELILDALKRKVVVTKRDLFYRSVKLFVKQARVDSIVEDIAATLQVRREDLNVVAAAKGLFAGHVKLIGTDGVTIEGGSQGALIPSSTTIERIECDEVKWVLIIEKEAVFQALCAPSFQEHLKERAGHGIILTGKGYPDIATRELVKRLSIELPMVPLLCLVDSDPHGLEILSTYKFGSSALAFDTQALAVERVRWIGVKGSEWDSLGVDRDELLSLTGADRKKALKMLQREWLPEEWKFELSFMLHMQRKAEIQVLSSARPRAPSAAATSSSALDGNDFSKKNLLVQYLARKIGDACTEAARSRTAEPVGSD